MKSKFRCSICGKAYAVPADAKPYVAEWVIYDCPSCKKEFGDTYRGKTITGRKVKSTG